MDPSKQNGVKLPVEQQALVYTKASVFKNRSKIPLPSPAFAVPARPLFLWLRVGLAARAELWWEFTVFRVRAAALGSELRSSCVCLLSAKQ